MKSLLLLATGLLSLLIFSCGDSGASEADLAAETEAERLETTTQAIEESIEEVEIKADELIDALDSLDYLFPEEE